MKGFWTQNSTGQPIHIVGDPDMPEETRKAIVAMSDALVERYERIKKYFAEAWNGEYRRGKGGSASTEDAEYWFREGLDRADHVQSTRERNAKEKAEQQITVGWLLEAGFASLNGHGERWEFRLPSIYGKLTVIFGDYMRGDANALFQVWILADGDMICMPHIKTVGQLAAFYELVEGKPLKERSDESTATH